MLRRLCGTGRGGAKGSMAARISATEAKRSRGCAASARWTAMASSDGTPGQASSRRVKAPVR